MLLSLVKRAIFQAVLLLAVVPALAAPHIVVIQADDLSVFEFRTCLAYGMCPNIQSLVNRGVDFPNAIVTNSVCAPSRATFLTGQYSPNNGVHCNEPTCSGGTAGSVTALDHSNTLPVWLQAAGYRTALVGKYVNLYGDTPTAPITSPRNPQYVAPGWTTWQALVGISTYKSYGYTINDNGTLVTYGSAPEDHQTQVLADRATAWIAANHAAAPLFVYLTPVAVHNTSDYQLAPDNGTYADTWKHVNTPDLRKQGTPAWNTITSMPFFPSIGYPAFNEADISDKPITLRLVPLMNSTDISRAGQQFKHRMRALLSIDDMVGQVEAAFGGDPVNVIVTSDNGWNHGWHRRGEKMLAYDLSIMVPLVVAGPGVVPGVRQEAILNNDLAPTIVALSGATPGRVMDGRSLVPLLQGQTVPWRQRAKVEHWTNPSPAQYVALRTTATDALPSRLYVEWPTTTECELYNGITDPSQLQNVCGSQPDEKAALKFLLDALRVCSGAACVAAEN